MVLLIPPRPGQYLAAVLFNRLTGKTRQGPWTKVEYMETMGVDRPIYVCAPGERVIYHLRATVPRIPRGIPVSPDKDLIINWQPGGTHALDGL